MKRIFRAGTLLLILITYAGCKPEQTGAGQKDSFSFVFLTDIHVQPEKRAAEGFRMAIEKVNSLNPDFVLTGGDLIMDALEQSESRTDSLYDLYTELSHLFNMPVYNTMGNHELFGIYPSSGVSRDHSLYGEKMYEERIGRRYYAFNFKGWRFYILDTVEETEDRKYTGLVDSLQLEWLKEDLASVDPGTPIAISGHIPFITISAQLSSGSTAANRPGLVVSNSREVLGLFTGHNLKLVLQGHLHFLEALYTNGVYFITAGAVSASWWNGPRGRLEEGFLLVKVRNGQISWEYIEYGWEAAQ